MRAQTIVIAAVGGIALGVGTRQAVWIWLPIAFAVILSAHFATERWLRSHPGFLIPLCLALLGGVTTGWVGSSPPFTLRLQLFASCALLTAGSVIRAVAVFDRLDVQTRRAGVGAFAIVAMAWTVSVASSAHAGAGGMIDWVVAHLGISPDAAHTLVLVVRKSIHFTYYGALGLIAGMTSRTGRRTLGQLSPREDLTPAIRFGFVSVLLIASFDELRQTTQPGRSGSAYDVMLDCAGAAFFLACLYASSKPWRREKRTMIP